MGEGEGSLSRPAPDFEGFFNALPGAFLVLTPELRLVAISDALLRATFTKRADLLGRYVFDVLPDDPDNPSGFESWRASLEKVIRTRTADTMPVVKYSIRLPDSEGGVFTDKYWRPANYPLLGLDGEVRYIIHRTEEVTELQLTLRENQAAQARTLEAESRMRFALRAAGMGDWELNLVTGKAFRSLKHDQCFGYQELLPSWTLEDALRHIHPDDRRRVEQAHLDVIAGKGDMNFESRVVWPDGSVHWITARARVERDEAGQPVRMAGLVWEITAQKDAEKERQMLAAVVESAGDFIGICDTGFRSTFLNPAGRALVGFGERDLAETDMLDYFAEGERERFSREVVPAVQAGGAWEAELLFRNFATGAPIPVLYNIFPIKDRDSGHTLAYATVSRDITERRKLEQSLREAVSVRDEFLSIASHELKTPITSLKLQLQMSRRMFRPELTQAPSPESLARAIDTSARQVDRLTALVEDLLDVARIQSGKLQFSFEETLVEALIGEVVSRFTEQIELVRSRLSVEVSPGLVAWWDRSRIEQVMVNLLSNAIKYAPGGALRISVTQRGGWATLIVQDSGPGIPRERQSQIFERFERATSSRSISGLGLGLFIVREIVRGHRGRVSVESEPGEGAKFIVELPLVPPAALAIAPRAGA